MTNSTGVGGLRGDLTLAEAWFSSFRIPFNGQTIGAGPAPDFAKYELNTADYEGLQMSDGEAALLRSDQAYTYENGTARPSYSPKSSGARNALVTRSPSLGEYTVQHVSEEVG